MAQQILDIHNRYRAERGLPPLHYNRELSAAAQGHANWMAATGNFSFTGQGGSSWAQRIQAAGYRGRALGENIGQGPMVPERRMQQWRNIPSAYANIVSSQVTQMGVGWRQGGRLGGYWVVTFGG